ncbi:M4 family metallopeptidase [Nocardioides sp. Root190]|uniref:M4 family metallopeptidase n=1 Tax=Nocardioides sp. Root190 TaxID=1736488 RepID=UPI000B32F1A5|nr:M4 family metallopeptidase [Nocardioides sp. Root190]
MGHTLSGLLRRGIGLSLVGAVVAVVPSAPVTAAPKDPSVVQEMRTEADGDVTVTTSPATDQVSFVSASNDLFPSERAAKSLTGASAKANGYVEKYARAFGATPAQLGKGTSTRNAAGYTVDFTQSYRGVPVFASRLRAQVDNQGDLTSVSGFVAPKLDLDVTPRLDEAAATAKAIKLASQSPAGVGDSAPDKPKASTLSATSAELVIYRTGAIQGVEGRNLLAWVVEVTDGKQVRETSILDARTGKPVNRYSMIAHALDRELHEESIDSEPVWSEGDDFPGVLDGDQANEVMGTGEAYWLFKNSFGRDSYDGAGAKMITVNNDPTIECPNANWNGTSTNYCSGVSSDDTVAHEWGHAYTEYTSGLLYQWQPGAMNEAYSDIWGESVDMLNNRLNAPDEDTLRTDGLCSKGTRGDIAVVISAPVGSCTAAPAAFGPIIDHVEGSLVVGTDAVEEEDGEVVGTETDGCSPFDNAAALSGKFVYVDRGLCPFADKMANAEDAGATGIVFGNNREGVSSVAGDSDLYGAMVSQEDGAEIKAAEVPLTITLDDAVTDPRDASYRWLSGEDDPAFGGAIRDMWNPNCYGDPGKVSDEEYFCDTDDSGGVHSNSGVVNHAYALLVDGGSYNGITVPALGLDTAANIFWHTQASYLTPTSGFAELADSLEASCAVLTGNTGLKKLTLGVSATGGAEAEAPALPPITASDCEAVTKVIAATELRVEPVQCNFRPMFRPGTIGCGDGTVTKKVWSQDFESGLPATWTKDVEADNAYFEPTVTTSLPLVTKGGTQHKGGSSVLYFDDKGEAGNFGSCNGDAEDYSSRVGVATPSVTVPVGALPRFSFDHYMASEVSFDGGNVKVSVNGGAYELVPDGAWLYNAPGGQLESLSGGNTNPMAGETAFTGTDGGEPTGAWGSSVIDLGEIADAGDKVRFRFDFGMDGCNGIDGWYIDNVAVSICEKPATPPKPSSATVAKTATAKKGVVKISVKVASGATPSRYVIVRIKNRTYTGKVVKGVLTIKARPQLRRLWNRGVRRVNVSVTYAGDAKVARFSGTVRVKLAGRQ